MHKLLERQLRRHFGSVVPSGIEGFLGAVDEAYHSSDSDRELLERSIENVSGELVDRFHRLQEALAMVEATLEATADGVLVVDQRGHTVRTNSQFHLLWQVPESLRTSWDDKRGFAFLLSQVSDPDSLRDHMLGMLAQAEESSFELLDLRDGRILEAQSMPQRMAGETVGRVWTFRDLTARRQLEDQLRQAQKMEAVGRLAGGIAHDFNNLLTVVRGNAEFIEHVLKEHGMDCTDVGEVFLAADRGAALTRQLLSFSRKHIVEVEAIDLNDVVEGVEPMIRRLIGADISTSTRLSDGGVTVMVDRGLLEQVLINLAVNARDAMPEGGELSIEIFSVDLSDSESQARNGIPAPGHYAAFKVTDTGEGIPDEVRDRIFEPFFTTKGSERGTGLGLATVYNIVNQSKGWVTIESEVGKGTSFTVFLPKVEGVVPVAARAVPPPRDLRGTETILVAEDNDAVRNLIHRTLSPLGYRLIVVRDGADGMMRIAEGDERVDLILSDVIMPRRSGRQLADFVRAIWPDARVLFISGYTDNELTRDGVLASDTFFLQKPFSGRALAAAVREAIESPRPATERSSDRTRGRGRNGKHMQDAG